MRPQSRVRVGYARMLCCNLSSRFDDRFRRLLIEPQSIMMAYTVRLPKVIHLSCRRGGERLVCMSHHGRV